MSAPIKSLKVNKYRYDEESYLEIYWWWKLYKWCDNEVIYNDEIYEDAFTNLSLFIIIWSVINHCLNYNRLSMLQTQVFCFKRTRAIVFIYDIIIVYIISKVISYL